MKFKALIFDMDGLLVDSERVWFDAETEIIELRGFKYTQKEREQIIGMRVDEFMQKLHEIYGFKETPQQLTDELIKRMLEIIPLHVQAQPGAHEIVQYVINQNIPHAVASSSSMPIIDATLASQGWGELFQVRCTADDEKFGKPAPDVYLTAAHRLGVDPKDCLALEDSPNGSRAAVAAGMTCFAVPDRSHSGVKAFEGITPYVFHDLHEVLQKIRVEQAFSV